MGAIKKKSLSFRQVHLDFHTSEHIPDIGSKFDKERYQRALKEAHVSSITTFACCHHGWSYHPTKVGKMHPNLEFNLLREQIDAAHEIGVQVPIYLTAGVHNVASSLHPEWRAIGADGKYLGWTREITAPGFHSMCFNSLYLDFLCEQIQEVMQLFPDGDGIFTDIIKQHPCCCRSCLQVMEENDLDPTVEEDRLKCAEIGRMRYYRMATETVQRNDPEMPLFHNSGHLFKNQVENLRYFSHVELESLPTGGWGYDHFPLSAKYCEHLGYDYLGMTGKFHLTWGEFGGFKHPNALRYECAAMIAFGAKCSVGDQLHPSAEYNPSTYRIIGSAYREVEAKEAWCEHTSNVADIALLSHESYHGNPPNEFNNIVDTGTARLLLECHFLFDVINEERGFNPYKIVIIPDDFVISTKLQEKIDAYLDQGGKLILSGESGLNQKRDAFLFDLGAEHCGKSPFNPDYIKPIAETAPELVEDPIVTYGTSQRIKATTGKSLGDIYDPYFNRDFKHFCSHRHTPHHSDPSGYDAAILTNNTLYFAHPIFTIYYRIGAVAYKEFIKKSIDQLLGEDHSFQSNLPSGARISLRHQTSENRYVLHLLYGPAIKRGSPVDLDGGNLAGKGMAVELIEDLPPLVDIDLRIRLKKPIKRITSEPDGTNIPFEQKGSALNISVDRFSCHKMLVMHY